jgi:hypothetical protein
VERDMTSLWQLVMECLSDVMLKFLLLAALLSMVIGIF